MVKGRKSATTQTVPAHLRRVLLVSSNTHSGGIAGKPNHDTTLPARALVSHLVFSCATVLVHARRVRHSLCPAILLPQCRLQLPCRCLPHLPLLLTLACLICRCFSLVQTKNSEVDQRHPGGLRTEQTLSLVVRVLVSFEHETGSFYTRHQNS